MAAPPLADPPEPSAGGTVAATPAVAPVSGANAEEAGLARDPSGAAKADEALEHGWTGLGLPQPDLGPSGRASAVPQPPAPAAQPAAAAPQPAPPITKGSPAAPGPAASAPRPTGRSGPFPAVTPPRPTGRSGPFPAVTPPRPTGRSGPFPAVTPPARDETSAAPPAARPSSPSAVPGRPSAPEAVAARPTPPTAPAPVPDRRTPPPAVRATPPPAPAPAPSTPPAAAPAPAPPAPPAAAFAPPPQEPEETEVTVEDEPPDLGATIPDTSPPFHDLSATVPNLPQPSAAPSFGLPPEPTSAEEASPYGPGAIIGDKYQLIRVIGRGGMGAVWIARNTALDVEVAIKLMRRDRATAEAAARFTTEARAAAKLGHPSIVRVFDFGETSRGDPFIVMELLRGESFGALLARKKKLSPTIAVQTLLPVAHALSAAHAKGIVHRDLKPDNILLAKDESNVVTPKVVDFGIAKLMSADVERHFTIAGEILGSPDYMSPEQARGEDDIDHRSDIWTFTVLLYEAICGRRPFLGANYNALLAAIIAARPPSLAELGIPDPALWSILEKGLAKDRDQRWQSVREMAMELARWALDHGAEHDLAGASLAAQWLEPTRRRLFTVGGAAPFPEPEQPAAPAPDVAIPKPPPLGNLAAEVPKATAPAISNTLPPFVPRRRPWVVMMLIVVIGGAVVAALVFGGLFDPPPAPPAAAPEPSASAVPIPTVTEAPSATEAPTATSTAKPTSTAKARPPGPYKPRAPQVKDDIKF